MCIIVYKPYEKKMPNKKILKHCWDNNDDGAGYMYPNGKDVVIKKGFMKFDSFYESLTKDYRKMGRFTPFVLHFRISTQAGVNEQCTHPFPLSREMDDLRKTRTTNKIGIAHNGVISLTKSAWNVTVTYSDTMKFITDYASLLIKDKDFYKDRDLVTLLDRLVGGRLAIMDYEGHTELIGEFKEKDGIYYSNNTFEEDRVRKSKTTVTTVKTITQPVVVKREDTKPVKIDTTNIIKEIEEEERKEKEKIKNMKAPDIKELEKMSRVDRGRVLDAWYAKHMISVVDYDFEEKSCPKFYENDAGYCLYCNNWANCQLKRGGKKEDGKLEY